MWLVKAPDLNRGRCIKIGDRIEDLSLIIKKFYEGIYRDFKSSEEEIHSLEASIKKGKKQNKFDYKRYRSSCVLLQKYLEMPLLYKGRKFDIRVWVLYTHKDTVYAFK